MNIFRTLSERFSVPKYRWLALAFISLGLAIVVIDNTVLVVAIPYILRDLHTSFDAIQWVVSGYSLLIATLLITMGRLGDVLGRKKVFLIGVALFALGSFIASVSANALVLFIGEAFIEALGAAMMLTTALAIIADEFRGRERAMAFGIWGSIAGASASVGPLLGGYLTSYYSWRWSFRINVIVAVIALLGSVFIHESKGEGEKRFDWWGTIWSGIGLFALIFAVIEGRLYGWWAPAAPFVIGSFRWPFTAISIIPVMFAVAAVSIWLFLRTEYAIEQSGGHPLLRLSIFKQKGFSMGLLTLMIVSFGQFGVFLILPVYLQSVLGLSAFDTGLTLLYTSVTIFVFGPLSGYLAAKIHPRYLVNIGMLFFPLGVFWLAQTLSMQSTPVSLGLPLILFGIGIGLASSQLNNIIISAIHISLAGEASAASATIRQIGSAVGSAIVGMILAVSLSTGMVRNISADAAIPAGEKPEILAALARYNPESVQTGSSGRDRSPVGHAVKRDIDLAMTQGAKNALYFSLAFLALGALSSFLLPVTPIEGYERRGGDAGPAAH